MMEQKVKRKIYIPNRSSHDFSAAESFGELVFVTNGRVNRYDTNQMHRDVEIALCDSTENDYIIITSLSSLCSILTSFFVQKHGKLNLLLFENKSKTYVERNHVF